MNGFRRFAGHAGGADIDRLTGVNPCSLIGANPLGVEPPDMSDPLGGVNLFDGVDPPANPLRGANPVDGVGSSDVANASDTAGSSYGAGPLG